MKQIVEAANAAMKEYFPASREYNSSIKYQRESFVHAFKAGAEWYRNHLANIPWDEAMQEIAGKETKESNE